MAFGVFLALGEFGCGFPALREKKERIVSEPALAVLRAVYDTFNLPCKDFFNSVGAFEGYRADEPRGAVGHGHAFEVF